MKDALMVEQGKVNVNYSSVTKSTFVSFVYCSLTCPGLVALSFYLLDHLWQIMTNINQDRVYCACILCLILTWFSQWVTMNGINFCIWNEAVKAPRYSLLVFIFNDKHMISTHYHVVLCVCNVWKAATATYLFIYFYVHALIVKSLVTHTNYGWFERWSYC